MTFKIYYVLILRQPVSPNAAPVLLNFQISFNISVELLAFIIKLKESANLKQRNEKLNHAIVIAINAWMSNYTS